LSFLDSKIADYHLLYQIDEQISKLILKYHVMITHEMNYHRMSLFRNYEVKGSMAESCFSPSLFFHDSRFANNIQKSADIDLGLQFMEIPKKYRHCVVDKRKKGFATILQKGTDCYCEECFIKMVNMSKVHSAHNYSAHNYSATKIRDRLTDEWGYMLPYKIKKAHYKGLDHPNSQKYYENIFFATIFQKLPRKVKTMYRHLNITKATHQISFGVSVEGKLELLLSIDFSQTIGLQWRSVFVDEWIRRRRAWPIMEMMGNSLDTTFLISKTSHEEKHNKKSRELRYSFFHIERKLTSLQSQHQRVIYYIAKSIFYRWIKPIDSDVLTSFLLKNTFMWVCEEYAPDHMFWRGSSRFGVKHVIIHLYLRILRAFQRGYMPYFFIPDVNVLSNIPRRLRIKIIWTLKRLTRNITHHIPFNAKEVLRVMETARFRLYKTIDIIKKLYNLGLIGFVSNGELYLHTPKLI